MRRFWRSVLSVFLLPTDDGRVACEESGFIARGEGASKESRSPALRVYRCRWSAERMVGNAGGCVCSSGSDGEKKYAQRWELFVCVARLEFRAGYVRFVERTALTCARIQAIKDFWPKTCAAVWVTESLAGICREW